MPSLRTARQPSQPPRQKDTGRQPDRHARPVGDDAGHRQLVHRRQEQRRAALRLPWRLSAMQALLWAVAAVLYSTAFFLPDHRSYWAAGAVRQPRGARQHRRRAARLRGRRGRRQRAHCIARASARAVERLAHRRSGRRAGNCRSMAAASHPTSFTIAGATTSTGTSSWSRNPQGCRHCEEPKATRQSSQNKETGLLPPD